MSKLRGFYLLIAVVLGFAVPTLAAARGPWGRGSRSTSRRRASRRRRLSR